MNQAPVIAISHPLCKVEVCYPREKGEEFYHLMVEIIKSGGSNQSLVCGPSFAVGSIGRDLPDHSTNIFYTEPENAEKIKAWIESITPTENV